MIAYFLGDWRRLAVRGVAALLFGVATLVWPDITLWSLVVMFGAFALVDGVASLSAAIAAPFLRSRGWLALSGLTGIAAGIVTFVWPSITALVLQYAIAVWALAAGLALIATAVRIRREVSGEWRIALAGGLSVLLGVMLIATPGDGALAITWAIGWYAGLFGLVLLQLAWTVRHETGRSPQKRHPSGAPAGQAAS